LKNLWSEKFLWRNTGPGTKIIEIDMGYMEVIDVADILKSAGIKEKTIFYGVEDIVTNNPIWKVFS
jgi:KUP system potassium uptake protein